MSLDAVLSLANHEWCVIPLHDLSSGHCSCSKGRSCRTPGKHPRLDGWQNHGTIDEATIHRWWRQWPHANVGIVTGHASRLAVLDIDPRHNGDESLREFERSYAPMPDTPLVLSGGHGLHYYFRLDAEMPSPVLAPGVEFLAEGHQVVAPRSLHLSGKYYEWEICHHPDDVPLAPLPAWLQAVVYDKATTTAVLAASLPQHLPDVDLTTLRVSARIKQLIRTGEDFQRYPSRSEAVFGVMQALVAARYSDEDIAAIVLNPNHGVSAKPLTQKNPRSPRYSEQTRIWVAREIARARSKYRSAPRGGSLRERAAVASKANPWHLDARDAAEVKLWH